MKQQNNYIIFLLVCILSCTKNPQDQEQKKDDKTISENGKTTPNITSIITPTTPITLQEKPKDIQIKTNETPKTAPNNTSLTPKSTFLIQQVLSNQALALSLATLPKTQEIIPDDFVIGRLITTKSPEVNALYTNTYNFLASIQKNNTDWVLVREANRTLIKKIITGSYTKEKAFKSFRIGNPVFETETQASINIRIFSETSNTQGEIYFIKENNIWQIDDISINFNELLVIPEKKLFEPEIYTNFYK